MSLPIDGSEDTEIHIKGLSGIDVGDWRGDRSDIRMPNYDDWEESEIGEDGEDDEGWEYDHRD